MKLSVEDIARLDIKSVRGAIKSLDSCVDSMGYTAPDDGHKWQMLLNRCAECLSAIADGLRIREVKP